MTAAKKPAAKKAPARKAVPAKKAATEKKRRATPSHKAVPKLHPVEDLTPKQRADLQAASKIVREAGLTPRQQLFVVEYAKDANGSQAVMRAGFTTNERSATVSAVRMLADPSVKRVIDAIMNDRVERGIADGDAVISAWVAQSQADANSLTQYRRVACRYCYGKGFRYQYTPAELEEAREKHADDWRRTTAKVKAAKKGADVPSDPPPFDEKGGLGFRGNRDPNPDCPECWGEGVGRPYFADTRKINDKDKVLFAGVKTGKEGIEILMHDAEGARDKLARHLGLYKDKLAEAVAGTYTPETLQARFGDIMARAKAKQDQVNAERSEPKVDGQG
jgi:phage terminase small subunit